MPDVLANKTILLGVSGGIAAYKSIEILRLLQKKGAEIRVMMSKNATRFASALTFHTLSSNPVLIDLFDANDAPIQHIEWAESAHGVILAPATANLIGKIASGIADDALTTVLMAVTSPVLCCPAMNVNMYQNRFLQNNLTVLESNGISILDPDEGALACGTTGPGRLPDPELIVNRFVQLLHKKDLLNKNVLVTAGPTREYFDPVRFLSNPSSGKMGFAIAEAAELRGANVTLVTGPTYLPNLMNVKTIRIESTTEMANAVFAHSDQADIIIKSAAVSDYHPVDPKPHKIKKTSDQMTIVFEKNIDILMTLGQRKKNQVLIGFAAETKSLENHALEKLQKKNLDMIIGNLINAPDAGFEKDTNRITMFLKNGEKKSFPTLSKNEIAHIIIDHSLELLSQKS